MSSDLPPMPPGPPDSFPPPPPPPAPPSDNAPPPPIYGESSVPPQMQGDPLPWEQPGYPALEGLFETAKLVITEPSNAFRRMPITGDLTRPLIYAVIFGWIGIIAGQIYNLALRGTMMRLLPGAAGAGQFSLPWMFNVGVMIVAPVLVLLGVLIGAAIFHLFLLLVGAANSGFGATVRVVCYTGTVQIFQIVPFCGGLIGTIWGIVLYIIGFAAAHRTTTGKAAVAVLLPVALCCVCIAVVIAAFGAAIMAAISHLR